MTQFYRPSESRHLLTVSTRVVFLRGREISSGLGRADLLYSGDSGWEANGSDLIFSLP
jgi:hypothetical protein